MNAITYGCWVVIVLAVLLAARVAVNTDPFADNKQFELAAALVCGVTAALILISM
jgi:hypothetical protein